jgi:hypothetical protein
MKSIFVMIALVVSASSSFANEYPADNNMLLKDLPTANFLDAVTGGHVTVLHVNEELTYGIRFLERGKCQIPNHTADLVIHSSVLMDNGGVCVGDDSGCVLSCLNSITVGEAIEALGKTQDGKQVLSFSIREVVGSVKNLQPGPKF